MSRVDGGWPLVGRDSELRSIGSVLDDVGGVFLDGGAGVGKTRLARAALDSHDAGRVHWVIATHSSRNIPLGAFGPLLGALPDGAGAALAGAQAALRDDRTLLAVDDAHLLDNASATLLNQLATDRECRMVVTVRTGEPVPDAVTALWKDGLLTRLEVPTLTLEQTTTLLEQVLDGRIERVSAQGLFTATAGNVLWLRHLLDGELAGGRLLCTAGVWRWIGEPRLSSALITLLEARIGALSSELRRVLELLALGEPLDVDLVQSLTGPAAVEDAADRELVAAYRIGRRWEARLAHPLYGEAVRARMNPVRARRLRGQLVEALTGTGDQDVLRQAVLAADSDLTPDPDLFLAGAIRAGLLTEVALAERLIRTAREYGAGFEAQLMLAFYLSWQHRGEEAERELVAAAALTDADPLRLRVASARAINLFLLLDRPQEAPAVLDAEQHRCGAEVELLGTRAFFALAAGRCDDAGTAARRALTSPTLTAHTETYAGWTLTAVEALAGGGDQVSAVAARAITAARRAPETAPLQLNIAWWEIFGLGLAGLLAPARAAVDRVSSALRGTMMAIFQTAFEGWYAMVTGRVITAAGLLCEFRPICPGTGGGWTAMLELILAQARAMTGDAAGAGEAIERAEKFRHPGMAVLEPQFALARAWCAAADGATSTAVKQARQAAMLAGRSGQLAIELLARHAAVSFGDRAQAARLALLACRVDGPRAPAAAAHAAAWATQDAAALLAASAQLAAAGLMLPAAEAAAQAVTLYRQADDVSAGGAAARQLDELVAACEGARTPALLAAARPLPISERQREIAALAARLSNREIAARLGISVRTVEGHIYHACMKLGLPDRTALSALFASPPRTAL